jgi:PAS domain-containing protein
MTMAGIVAAGEAKFAQPTGGRDALFDRIADAVHNSPDPLRVLINFVRDDHIGIIDIHRGLQRLKLKSAQNGTQLSAKVDLDELFVHCLEQTYAVDELALERSTRGYVQTDATGVIVYANHTFTSWVPHWRDSPLRLTSLFPRDEDYINEAIAADQRRLRRLEMVVLPERRMWVSVELGRLTLNEGAQRTWGYALIGDLSPFLESEQRLYARTSIGIIRLDARRQVVYYANQAAAEMLGHELQYLHGCDPRILFPLPDNSDPERAELRRRNIRVLKQYFSKMVAE